jgi:Protein of unknown function (DUF5132)
MDIAMCLNMEGIGTMPTGNGQASFSEDETPPSQEAADDASLGKAIAAVAVVAVGAALFEVALLPGIALGVAAVAAPKYLPRLGGALNPLFKSTVRGTYKFAQKSKEMFAEAQEQVHDIVAEVKAEGEAAAKEAKATEKHAA